ncbi:hypothetical protein LTR62_001897 [Meristemomyces frigidus]|uniref:FAD/NAD(P)-binding domain-containing protein n=1 Tax=Meristemomyces frigidus TaxID=1508187 RepID=A0AAN7TAM7_9PEZI|nr:hypothetical protein LTR62_001897 [Meristemomyces frigidus]
MGSIGYPPSPAGSHDEPLGERFVFEGPKRYLENGLSVLVVGGGPGGLLTTLECWRKGSKVTLVDRASGPHDGSNLYGPASCQFNDLERQVGRIGPHVGFMQNRRNFFFMLLRQLDQYKISIIWRKRVSEYYEDEKRNVGGVLFDNGERTEANVIVAAGRGLHLSVMVSGDFVRMGPVKALIHTTPKDTLVHWKLRWRDLNTDRTSPDGRIVQVGDSCYLFLPASGNGATQALKDATSLATCLHIGGKGNARVATKIHNRLRYERVSCSQLTFILDTQQHHFADWSKIAARPSLVRTRFPEWMFKHDPEAYAISKYAETFMNVVSNGEIPLMNTNYLPEAIPISLGKWRI